MLMIYLSMLDTEEEKRTKIYSQSSMTNIVH